MVLFDDGGGLAFLDVVFVPGGDLDDVGAGFFDDALAAEAAVELQAGGEFEAVEFEVFGFGDALGTLLQEDVAGGAGGNAATGVVEEDAIVLGNVEEAHGLSVAVVGERVEGELDGLMFRFEGDADHIVGGRLGEVDFGERGAIVIRHGFSILGHRSGRRMHVDEEDQRRTGVDPVRPGDAQAVPLRRHVAGTDGRQTGMQALARWGDGVRIRIRVRVRLENDAEGKGCAVVL